MAIHHIQRFRLRHASVCLLAAVVGWIFSDPLGPSEFSGGWVTGPLLALHDLSGYLLVLSSAMIFVYRRVASGVALVACALSLPLYFYFIGPGLFRMLIPDEWKVLLQAGFAWNTSAVIGIVSVTVATFVSVTSLGRQG
jgi:hypothetical protein